MGRPRHGVGTGSVGNQQRHQRHHCMYAHYRLSRIPLQHPDSGRLHYYCQDEEDGAKGSAFGSGMHSGIHVGKAVKTDGPDKIEEKPNSYEYIAYCVQRSH
jgi:hypothetical protein